MIDFHKGHCALGVFHHTCLDLYVVLVKLIVDGCFCSDLLSTGWSGGIDPPDSPTSGRKSGWCFWTWTVLKIRLLYLDLDYKARSLEIVRILCPVCLREGFAGRDAVESTQERASHQLQSARFILLLQPVQKHALLIPHQQRFIQSTACPAQIRWVWSLFNARCSVCAISISFQFQRFACSSAKASLQITEVTLMYANTNLSVTNKHDRKENFCLKKTN